MVSRRKRGRQEVALLLTAGWWPTGTRGFVGGGGVVSARGAAQGGRQRRGVYFRRGGGELEVEYEVVLEADDAFAWVEERREYLAIQNDAKAPRSLTEAYRDSYTVRPAYSSKEERRRRAAEELRYFHAFDGRHASLEDATFLREADDETKLGLVRELLGAVGYLHARGLPHLALNSKCVRVSSRGALTLVGAGAGPKLVATKRPFALPEEWWPFNAPETTGVNAMIIQSNLRALLSMDAWAVGVLVVMIVSGARESPFDAEPNWTRGIFDDRAAVGDKTRSVFADFATFLRDLDATSNGCLTRHGWLVKLVLGLLTLEATDRMTVADAAALAGPDEASRRRFGPPLVRAPASGEPFRSLEAVVNIIEGGACDCVLQDRPFDTVPYGEILGFRNRGDGDRWDLFVPGLPAGDRLPLDATLRIAKLIGIVLVKGGNHKLAVELVGHPPNAALVLPDVRRFIDAYVASKPNLAKSRVRYLEYSGKGP